MGVADRAGNHVFHIQPQRPFMTGLGVPGSLHNPVPLVGADSSIDADCDSLIGFRTHPDPRLFEVIGVEFYSFFAVSLLHDPLRLTFVGRSVLLERV